ncbi:TetR family transcriptional regulator [Nocardia sp. SYP-A9097]|uniref:TetR/AcrR family transcriptional regulator n=1 Tax=Nocardia sp. SYP-A9097 TaxID=2663237 RepID=UPI00129ACF81|nr:TetR/AcrR family transcriptional regulator [Nocardia sp. SYP-A9097]MRH91988.1 TetR family transcriptional regulator [Nocardia sp. SYP-A9097]
MNSDIGPDKPQPRRRSGGRSARVREAVIAATLQQVLDHGIEGLSLGSVAARAGVSETTIYRRWGSRTALITDAVNDLAAVGNPPPQTGALREDLQQILEQIARLITRPGVARLLGTAAALDADPELTHARTTFWNNRFDQIAPVVERARTAGTLRTDARPREVLETLAAPLYFRLLVTTEPIDAELITRCVEHTITLYQPPP